MLGGESHGDLAIALLAAGHRPRARAGAFGVGMGGEVGVERDQPAASVAGHASIPPKQCQPSRRISTLSQAVAGGACGGLMNRATAGTRAANGELSAELGRAHTRTPVNKA